MKIQSAITCYKQRRQLLLTFLTMVTRWSCSEEPPRGSYAIVCKYVCSTSNLYALIGQNLPGEFMRKIYTAIWNLFTLATETDRVLCHLVMFLTVFFHWLYKNEICDSRKYPYPPPPTDGQWKFQGGGGGLKGWHFQGVWRVPTRGTFHRVVKDVIDHTRHT